MHIVLGPLQGFISLGATAGGSMLVIDPSGAAMRLPLSWLDRLMSADDLIPGLFLFHISGFGSMLGAIPFSPRLAMLVQPP